MTLIMGFFASLRKEIGFECLVANESGEEIFADISIRQGRANEYYGGDRVHYDSYSIYRCLISILGHELPRVYQYSILFSNAV